jgi:ribosome maturation factor RimP
VWQEAPVKPIDQVEQGLDERVEALGFEVVEVEWGGTERRPIMRLRVDRPDSGPGKGVTVGDCARVSRAIEPWLDEHPAVPERYVLEVSSPGVERPLVRERDFRRFVGEEVRLKTKGAGLPGRLQGILAAVEMMEGDSGYRIVVKRPDGSEVGVPRDRIVRAQLVFQWGEEER